MVRERSLRRPVSVPSSLMDDPVLLPVVAAQGRDPAWSAWVEGDNMGCVGDAMDALVVVGSGIRGEEAQMSTGRTKAGKRAEEACKGVSDSEERKRNREGLEGEWGPEP